MKRISLSAIAKHTAFALLLLAIAVGVLFLFAHQTAMAQDFSLVLFDNGQQLSADQYTVKNNTYTLSYHSGISITAALADGEGNLLAEQSAEGSFGTVFTKTGKYPLSLSTPVGYTMQFNNYTICIAPAVLTVEWDAASLRGEYGQPAKPQVTWQCGDSVYTWETIVGDDADAKAEFLPLGFDQTTESDVDYLSDYLWGNGVLGTQNGKGLNDFQLRLTSTQYVLTKIPDAYRGWMESTTGYGAGSTVVTSVKGKYELQTYKGSIAIAETAVEKPYTLDGVDLVQAFGASVVDEAGKDRSRYTIVADVTKGGNTQKDVAVVSEVGAYSVIFHFAGDSKYYAASTYYCAQAATITVQRCPTVVVGNDLGVRVEFDCARKTGNAKTVLDKDVYARMVGGDYIIQESVGTKAYAPPSSELTFAYCSTVAGFSEDGYDASWSPNANFVGDLYVRIAFAGNERYEACSAILPLHILPFDLTFGIDVTLLASTNGYAYRKDTEADFVTGKTFTKSIAGVADYYDNERDETHEYITYQQQLLDETWQDVADTDNMLPGTYRARFQIQTAHYVGDKVSNPFVIRKVVLGPEQVSLGATAFVYGEEVDPMAAVDAQTIATYGQVSGTWHYTYDPAVSDGIFAKGTYGVILSLDDPVYELADDNALSYPAAIVVEVRSVTLTVHDNLKFYGSDWYPDGISEGQDVSWQEGAVLARDVEAFLQGLTVWAEVGETDYSEPMPILSVRTEGYPLHATLGKAGVLANYQLINSDANGCLYITQRPLIVDIKNKVIFENDPYELEKSISDEDAVFDEKNDLLAHISLFYFNEDGEEVQGSLAVGRYTVKAVGDEATANYLVSGERTIVVKSLQLSTGNSDFGLSGRFLDGSNITVTQADPSLYEATVKKSSLDRYHIEAVYEVSGKASVNTGSITVTLSCPATGKVAVLYSNGDEWKAVEFSRVGDSLTIEQGTLGEVYIVLAKREVNWMLLGIIAGAVVFVVLVVLVVLAMRKKKREAKLVQEASSALVAPTIERKPSEEDELDEFIDNFDESTVERELTPAEKIALREKEERYKEYRSRLARLRGSERTLSDTLAQLGLSKDADEDAIIERMIAEDEERARKLQEELEREEEERRKAEEAPTMVILDHSSETLEQQTYVPTQHDDDDLDDIDV